jgi:hypothetical protein
MGDGMGSSLVNICAQYEGSKITMQLVNISKAKALHQTSLEFLKELKYLYFTTLSHRDINHNTRSLPQLTLKLAAINAFRQQ